MSYLSVEETFPYLDKIPEGNLIEFGTFSGNTLNRLIKGAEQAGLPFQEVYSFDSFVGLPKEAPFVWQNPEWPEGAFNLCHDFGLNSVEEAIEFVRGRVERKNIELIPGFFQDSLTEELGLKLAFSASYIHCDVDIYSSSYQCMDWMWKYKILKPGGLIRLDDVIATPINAGQHLACKEMEIKYNLDINKITVNLHQFLGYKNEGLHNTIPRTV